MNRRLQIVQAVVGAIAFVAIVAGSFQPFYFQQIFGGRDALGRQLTALRFGKAPELRELLSGVRERTAPGDRIALMAPVHRWHEGYAYAYYRASYELTGREVVPLVTLWDEQVPSNLRHADYLLIWNRDVRMPEFEQVWMTESGSLHRRVR